MLMFMIISLSVCLRSSASPLHPLFVSGEAVFARCLSSLKEERVEASRSLSGPQGVKFQGDKAVFLEDIRKVKHVKKKKGSPVAEELSSDIGALCSYVRRLFMHPRSFPTRKVSCYCDRRPKNSAGPSTTAPSL